MSQPRLMSEKTDPEKLDLGRGGDSVGSPHRARISQFELFDDPALLLTYAIRGNSISVDSTLPPLSGPGRPLPEGPGRCGQRAHGARKQTNGVSTNGVTAHFIVVDRGIFWVLPLIYFYLAKSARAYIFPQSAKIHFCCSGPISVDPICPQPRCSCSRATAAA